MNDQSHDSDLVGPYVLDALDPEEREAFDVHLQTCASCRAEVAELSQVVNVLPLACEGIEPPSSLRERILERSSVDWGSPPAPRLQTIDSPRRGGAQRRPLLWSLLAAAAILVAAVTVWNINLHQEIDQKNGTVALQQQVITALAHGAVVSRLAALGPRSAASAAVLQPSRGQKALFVASGLPRPPSEKVYQLWLIRGTKPVSAGTFSPSGYGTSVVRMPMATAGYTVAAVTVEPGPHGSRAPTGPKVLAGRVAG